MERFERAAASAPGLNGPALRETLDGRMTRLRRTVLIIGLLALAGCLDWGPPTAGDGDSDADFDSDVDSDADPDGSPDAEADSDVAGDADAERPDDPFEGVTCSGHGACFTDGDEAMCVCENGYHAEGPECICTSDCGERECGMDPVCGTLLCGTCGEDEPYCNESSGACESIGLLDPSSGLYWDALAGRRNWASAVEYCNSLDQGGYGPGSWRLPTIGELRSLIRGCPETETAGECGVTDSCLGGGCWDLDFCWGCLESEGPGSEGAYWPAELSGNTWWHWSSSPCADCASDAWRVAYRVGRVNYADMAGIFNVRCVRPEPASIHLRARPSREAPASRRLDPGRDLQPRRRAGGRDRKSSRRSVVRA